MLRLPWQRPLPSNGALYIQQLWASGGRTREPILMKFGTQQQILFKSDHPQQKKNYVMSIFMMGISDILDFRGPIMGSLKNPCTTSYKLRSSIDTIAVDWLVYEKIAFFAFWRQDLRWRISAILDFKGPVISSLKSHVRLPIFMYFICILCILLSAANGVINDDDRSSIETIVPFRKPHGKIVIILRCNP